MVELSKYGVPFRCNAGMARALTGDGFIKLLPKGFSDLLFIQDGAKTIFIECKDAVGKQREAQKKFEKLVTGMGFEYLVMRSPDDVERLIKK